VPKANAGAWAVMDTCLYARLRYLQEVSHAIHSPIASNIVAQIREAFTNALPGLPCAELPVFAVSGKTSVHSLDPQYDSMFGFSNWSSLNIDLLA
jgi:hypothetical protein